MKKLHKNFRSIKQTIESMSCYCGGCVVLYCSCNCPDIPSQSGFNYSNQNQVNQTGLMNINSNNQAVT